MRYLTLIRQSQQGYVFFDSEVVVPDDEIDSDDGKKIIILGNENPI